MSVYKIVVNGDEVLRLKAKGIQEVNANTLKLLDNLKDTLYSTSNGIGLAAPQIGISKRVAIVELDDVLYELINPEIIMREGSQTDFEGCLSVPGMEGEVTRANNVKVRALNRRGEKTEITGEGLLARAFQHEIDHLDGILFIDKAQNIRPE
ncbi:MAG: peptide deformylase [Clostridia bacterium]|nr:peptide deformylase [Clostridia bacterium]MDD4048496.1 peptide deformylase [Clostridia bacterium]